jgi:hypothetical protein
VQVPPLRQAGEILNFPCKPDACIVVDKIGVFMGADYKFLTLAQTDQHIAKLQGLAAILRRNIKRQKRAALHD